MGAIKGPGHREQKPPGLAKQPPAVGKGEHAAFRDGKRSDAPDGGQNSASTLLRNPGPAGWERDVVLLSVHYLNFSQGYYSCKQVKIIHK